MWTAVLTVPGEGVRVTYPFIRSQVLYHCSYSQFLFQLDMYLNQS